MWRTEVTFLKVTTFAILWPKLGPKYGPNHTENQIKFTEIAKTGLNLSIITFYFIKIPYVFTELWMIFCFVWYFVAKKGATSSLSRCDW